MISEDKLFIKIKELPERFFTERKKNTMGLEVTLVGATGTIVTGKYVELKATLLYENGDEVFDQSKLVSKNIRTAIGRSGKATLHYRIEDVSQNHKRRNFVIRLSPVQPEHQNIADGCTTPVFTMSKDPKSRSKKRRTDEIEDDDDDSDERSDKNMRQVKHHRQHIWQRSPWPTDLSEAGATLVDSMSHLLHQSEPKATAEMLCEVLVEYERAVKTLEQLRWIPIGENGSTGEVFYRNMTNPNLVIEGLTAR